jgi:hypothetical protein
VAHPALHTVGAVDKNRSPIERSKSLGSQVTVWLIYVDHVIFLVTKAFLERISIRKWKLKKFIKLEMS